MVFTFSFYASFVANRNLSFFIKTSILNIILLLCQ